MRGTARECRPDAYARNERERLLAQETRFTARHGELTHVTTRPQRTSVPVANSFFAIDDSPTLETPNVAAPRGRDIHRPPRWDPNSPHGCSPNPHITPRAPGIGEG